MNVNPASLIPLTGAILSTLLTYITIRKDVRARVHRAFVLLNISTFIWSFLYFIEINFRWQLYNPESPYTSPLYILSIMVYTGISTIPVHWFLFAAAYSRRMEWFSGWRRYAVYFPTFLAMTMMPTNAFHHLWYTSWAPDPYLEYGPLFYLYSAIAYSMVLFAMVYYIRFAWELREKIYRKQALVMLAGSTVVIAGNILWISRDFIGASIPVDPTPALFAVGNAIFAVALFRMGFLDLLPVATREVFHHMEDGAIVVDTARRIVEANPAAHRIFGEIIPGKRISNVSDKLHENLSSVHGKNEFEIRIRDSYFWVRVIDLITDEEMAGSLVILTDITQIKKKEEVIRKKNMELERAYSELEKAEAELIQSGKLSALRNLMEGMEPEIKRATEEIDRAIRIGDERDALSGIERLKSIIKGLQIFAYSKSPELSYVDIGTLIEEVVNEFKERNPDINITIKSGKTTEIYCSRELLKRAFSEIIKNSVEAMNGKGNLDISILWGERSQTVRIDFEDTGTGIPDSIRNRIFDPFFTTKGPGSAGLGLTFSLQVIHDHGGKIEVNPEENGTKISVVLPISGHLIVEHVFLIHKESGLLIEHTGIEEGMDEDILSSMFTAVMDFIKDSFSGEKEAALNMMDIGDRRIMVNTGKSTYMVVVFRGAVGEAFPRRVKRIHRNIEEKYPSLENWGGSKEALPRIGEELSAIMDL